MWIFLGLALVFALGWWLIIGGLGVRVGASEKIQEIRRSVVVGPDDDDLTTELDEAVNEYRYGKILFILGTLSVIGSGGVALFKYCL